MFHISKKSGYTSTAQLLCRMQVIDTVYNLLISCCWMCFFFPLGSQFDAEVLMLGPSLSYLACVLQPRPCPDTHAAHLDPGSLTCHPGWALSCPCSHNAAQPSQALSDPGPPCPTLSCPACSMRSQPGLCHLNSSVQVLCYKLNNGKGYKVHDFSIIKM